MTLGTEAWPGMVDTMGTDVSDHQLIYADVCWDRPDDRRNVG